MATETPYDLAVIGAGPGGYVAAIRAAQLGLKVLCIDKNPQFGGTCLRVGCIPSKALLDASEKFHHAKTSYASLGIQCDNVRLDLPAMMKRKTQIVEQLTGGIAFLFKKNKIDALVGSARFLSPTQLEVTHGESKQTVAAKNFLIATGSAPVELPFMKFDGTRIVSSDQAIALPQVPQSLVVVGAGAIGLELGSVWSRLGSKVTVLEMLPVSLGQTGDEEATRGLEKSLKKHGLTIYVNAKVTGAKMIDGRQHVVFDWEGNTKTEPADVILVAVGRRAYTDGLDLEKAGVLLDERKRVKVGPGFQTSVSHIYAIGDVIAGPMLAHKAEEEGIACVETLAGKHGHVNYAVIPGVVYTSPELAWVGLSEEQCKAQGIPVNIGKFRFAANGRALCMNETDGFVKIIADARTDRVLGVHILGPQASALIAEAAAVMEFAGSAEDIARTCHAHPSLPEAVKEAALAVAKRAIHA